MSTMTNPGADAQLVRAMAEAARWAPSVHNTQPWLFRAVPDGMAVLADHDRTLPVLDPTGRLRSISGGAAVLNAEVALAAAGFEPEVALVPDAGCPDLLAVVGVAHVREASDLDRRLAGAVPQRRAHRRVYGHEPAPEGLLADAATDATGLGARLTVAGDHARHALSALLTTAVREQVATPGLVEEVESWVRHRGTAQEAVDGILVESLGTGPYPVDSLVQEGTDPSVLAEAEVEEALSSSAVVAVSTPGDDLRDWLSAGRALERLWLHATAQDLAVSFTDQATQHPGTRGQLAGVFGVPGHVQVVVRVGRPLVDVPVTPRRPLEELLRWA